MMMHGCLENKTDIGRQGARYYNLGIFSVGISTAADSLAAVKKLVFEEKSVTAGELLQALRDNFEGHTPLRNRLMACPKIGNDDDFVDSIATELMETLAIRINGAPNGTGSGVWRVGTGSAQMYVSHGEACGATADGRRSGDYLSCSYSPALHARVSGPLSVIRSFTKFDLTNIINGGPLTMEIHDNVFRNAQGEAKVAELVRLFILSGGHQLQVNAINQEVLLDALEHPQDHQNLVVRVWGWSGYFCELDRKYQDHILQRTAYTF